MLPALAVLATVVFLVVAARFLLRKGALSSKCASCGSHSRFGYSERAESSADQIVRLCTKCLDVKLREDYRQYRRHAVVIEPAADFPCYVFQTKSGLSDAFGADLATLFSNANAACHACGSTSVNFLWLASKSLTPTNFSQVWSAGISQTLLRWGNDSPQTLCGECCASLIMKTIETNGLTFLEVCAPRDEDGIVLPMGY